MIFDEILCNYLELLVTANPIPGGCHVTRTLVHWSPHSPSLQNINIINKTHIFEYGIN